MANELEIFDIGTQLAAADYSEKQYYCMYLSAANTFTISGNQGEVIGVLQNKPAAAGRAGQIRIHGITQVEAGGTITGGQRVGSDTNGKAIVATAAKRFFGWALEDGTDGKRITVLMDQGYLPA